MDLARRYEDLVAGISNSRGCRFQGARIEGLGHVIYAVLGPGHDDLGHGARNSHGFRHRVRGFGAWGV